MTLEGTAALQRRNTLSEKDVTKTLVVIEPAHGWASLQLRALWEYRELLYFLVWRDVKVRYKQTALGVTINGAVTCRFSVLEPT